MNRKEKKLNEEERVRNNGFVLLTVMKNSVKMSAISFSTALAE